jgi:hypothetical protein
MPRGALLGRGRIPARMRSGPYARRLARSGPGRPGEIQGMRSSARHPSHWGNGKRAEDGPTPAPEDQDRGQSRMSADKTRGRHERCLERRSLHGDGMQKHEGRRCRKCRRRLEASARAAVSSLSRACGGGMGRGRAKVGAGAPTLSLPRTRAFTPVFDGLCGRGDAVARALATRGTFRLREDDNGKPETVL